MIHADIIPPALSIPTLVKYLPAFLITLAGPGSSNLANHNRSPERPMKAFHDQNRVKRECLSTIRQHRLAGQIQKGLYYRFIDPEPRWAWKRGVVSWRPFRQCNYQELVPKDWQQEIAQVNAIGATIHGGDVRDYEKKLGIPGKLAWLEEAIFDGLPDGLYQLWPEQFIGAIRTGADLTRVWTRYAIWLLEDDTDGVIQYAKTAAQREAIHAIVEVQP